MLGVVTSDAVIVCVGAVTNVTLNVRVPAAKAWSPGITSAAEETK